MNPLSMISPTYAIVHLIGIILCIIATTAFMSWIFPTIMDRVLPPPIMTPFYTFLPFRKIHEDGKTIIMNAKSPRNYVRVIELTGADISLAPDRRRETLFEQRKTYLDRLETTEITSIKFVTTKDRVQIKSNLRSKQHILHEIQSMWVRNFPSPTEITHYAIITKTEKSYDRAKQALDSAEQEIMTHLSEFGPQVMSEYTIENDKIKISRNGPLKAFGTILSPISRPSPIGMGYTAPLSALVAMDEVSFAKVSGSGVITFKNGTETLWAAVITYRDLGEKTTEAVCRELLSMDAQMMIYHAISPIPTAKAITTMRYHKRSAVLQHGSASSHEAYDQVLDKLEGTKKDIARTGMVNYAMHVIPMCRTRDELNKIQKRIEQIMTETRGIAISCKQTAQATYMSMIDPNLAHWPRRFRLPTDNVAAMIYPQQSLRTHIGSDWCKTEPAMWLPTINGDPFPFNFHVSDKDEAIGHTLLIGPSGAGKTTFLSLLAAMTQRIPEMRTIMLDRLNGLKVFTECAGGNYTDFANISSEGAMNPLLLSDTPINRAFLLNWLRTITNVNTAEGDREISELVTLIYRKNRPKEICTLKQLAPIAFSATGEIRRAIEPWINDAQYGQYFNARKENFLSPTARLTTYDMTQVLNNEKLAAPVVSYMIHSLQNIGRENRSPSLLAIDETKPMMANPDFTNRLLTVVLQEARKLRQVCILNFQSAGAIVSTGQTDVILNQCQTQVYFRIPENDSESSMDAYEAFGLNSSERDFIMGKTFKTHPYAVLIKRNGCQPVIADINVGRLGKYMKMFTGSGAKTIGDWELAQKSAKNHDDAVSHFLSRSNAA